MSATNCPDPRLGTASHNLLWLAFLLAALSGCQSLPQRADHYAGAQGMTRSVVKGNLFRHVIYSRRGDAGDLLHVYIDGDGQPWLRGVWINDDPTPRTPLALGLMARDSAPALYLGRPCYFGLAADPGCEPRYWTSARYSAAVVDSMAAALARVLATQPAREVVLIGYSGGGALAVLMAPRIAEARRVITVAGNLDTQRWAALHGFLALEGSLNPLADARLDGISHLHFGGGADANVPGAVARAFAERHGGSYRIIDGYDHRCCWRENWPALLYNPRLPATELHVNKLLTDNSP